MNQAWKNTGFSRSSTRGSIVGWLGVDRASESATVCSHSRQAATKTEKPLLDGLSPTRVRRAFTSAGPHRLARPRTQPFQGCYAGSNPAGDANALLREISKPSQGARQGSSAKTTNEGAPSESVLPSTTVRWSVPPAATVWMALSWPNWRRASVRVSPTLPATGEAPAANLILETGSKRLDSRKRSTNDPSS